MNLILSDVEETIMIVDVPEGAAAGQGTVNVRSILSVENHRLTVACAGRKKKNGDVVRTRRWCYTGEYPPYTMREFWMSNLIQVLIIRYLHHLEHEFVIADQSIVFLSGLIHCQYIFRKGRQMHS